MARIVIEQCQWYKNTNSGNSGIPWRRLWRESVGDSWHSGRQLALTVITQGYH